MKTFFVAVCSGAVLGTVLTAWLAPVTIGWYFAPPVEMAYTCKAAVDWGILTYRTVMLWGTAAGTAIALILFFFWKTRRRAKPEPATPTL